MLQTVDQFLASLPSDQHPVFDAGAGGFVLVGRRELGIFPKSYRDAAHALAEHLGLVLFRADEHS